jgi:hypothetical protein
MTVNEFDRAWAEALLDKVFKRGPLTSHEVSVLTRRARRSAPFLMATAPLLTPSS